ncbi:hypothetical protein G6F40_016346 [Rhizopus arrhizus]|nr:hypothetical protein G6F40_016346 [Rhizopus arrhizus]
MEDGHYNAHIRAMRKLRVADPLPACPGLVRRKNHPAGGRRRPRRGPADSAEGRPVAGPGRRAGLDHAQPAGVRPAGPLAGQAGAVATAARAGRSHRPVPGPA